MIPSIQRLPAILIVLVIACWGGARWHLYRSGRILTPVHGPVVSLAQPATGTWELTWPEWPDARSEPYVAAFGRPFIGFGAHYDPPLFLRIEPRDAVRTEKFGADADGWFEAGEDHDFDTVAWLDPKRAKRIEYRVGDAQNPTQDRASIQIRGIGDLMIWKNIVVNTGIVDSVAVLLLFLLVIWLVIARGIHERRQRRLRYSRVAG